MNLVLFTHPDFVGSNSQSRFARMLLDAYRQRGHRVELRQPKARLRRLIDRAPLAKWAGYVDQYLVFPGELRRAARRDPPDTLYVFCDQALGPWVPALAHRPHVVHCHDLLALRSALGEIPENPTSATGRVYQRYIRRGFRHARHFISISEKTRDDLHRVGGVSALTSEVVYNGLNHAYRPLAPAEAGDLLRQAGVTPPSGDFLLHVGTGQWYKNSAGVVALYGQLARLLLARGASVPSLWMVAPPASDALRQSIDALPQGSEVRFQPGLPAPALHALYATARALLFPSLAEGFGWPIAEALACGCPVLTTGEAPMTEVGGACAVYLPRLASPADLPAWAEHGAAVLLRLLEQTNTSEAVVARVQWARRFDADRAIDAYLGTYARVLESAFTSAATEPVHAR